MNVCLAVIWLFLAYRAGRLHDEHRGAPRARGKACRVGEHGGARRPARPRVARHGLRAARRRSVHGGKAARDATLLANYSIRALPLFVGLSALLSLPVIIVAGKLMVKYGPASSRPGDERGRGASRSASGMMITRRRGSVAVIVFFHLSTASAVLVSGFWSIVNERFDIHSAKRHIGRIGIGATLGGILGGVVAERTAVYLKPERSSWSSPRCR